jgi:nucleoside-diphosphate-sugar epimerase
MAAERASGSSLRVALVGGTRFIGHAAARALVARGHAVAVVHRGVHRAEVDGVTSLTADRSDVAALAAALKGWAPEAVVDTRAMTGADAETTLSALDGLRAAVVVLSSQDVYAQFGRVNGLPGPEPEERVTESSPLTVPFPFRGLAEHAGGHDYDKKEVERLFLSAVGRARPGVTILRLPAVYGPRDPQRRFGQLVDALDAGRTRIPGEGGWRWTHAHVDDVAHAIALAAEAAPVGGRIFNVGELQTPTMRERAECIAWAMGRTIEWLGGEPPDEWGLFGRLPNDVVVDSTAIRETLGWREQRSFEQRAPDLVAALRAN